MKSINEIMNHLTELKAESIQSGNPFGWSSADREIKAIDEVLQVFGVKWSYIWDESGKWIAVVR